MKSIDFARKIVGDNSNLGRKELDFYPTPNYVVKALIDNEHFNGHIWECACGKGNISNVLKTNGYSVYSSDLFNYEFGKTNIDFLSENLFDKIPFISINNIITNPPFNLSLEFILQAKKIAKCKIAMFLKTSFLEGVKRYEMFQDKEFPLKCIYQFVKRVSFGKSEGTYKNGGMIAFAWFIWDKDYSGKPYINWII